MFIPRGVSGGWGGEDPLELSLLMECFKKSSYLQGEGIGEKTWRKFSRQKTWGILNGVKKNHHRPQPRVECLGGSCSVFI